MRLVVGPAAPDLHPQLEKDLRVEQVLELVARLGADPLQPLAAAADDHRLVRVALDDDRRGDAAQPPFLLVLVDDDRRGVGQLVAGEPEQLLADDLGGEEAVAPVGERAFIVQPRLLRQVRGDDRKQSLRVRGLRRRKRDELGEGMARLHLLQPGREVGAAGHRVELVGDEERGLARRQQGEDGFVFLAEAARLDDEENDVDVAERARDGAVQRAIERGGMPRLEARRIDEDELRFALRADSGDAMPRRLRLVRGDADLLPDQGVEQCRLADVRPPDDGHQAAALHQERSGLPGSSLALSASIMRRAASCSAARRDLPSPDSRRLNAGTAHSTSKV